MADALQTKEYLRRQLAAQAPPVATVTVDPQTLGRSSSPMTAQVTGQPVEWLT